MQLHQVLGAGGETLHGGRQTYKRASSLRVSASGQSWTLLGFMKIERWCICPSVIGGTKRGQGSYTGHIRHASRHGHMVQLSPLDRRFAKSLRSTVLYVGHNSNCLRPVTCARSLHCPFIRVPCSQSLQDGDTLRNRSRYTNSGPYIQPKPLECLYHAYKA